VRALQAITFCGVLLGMLLYAWLAVRSDAVASHRGLAEAAAVGQVAADAELARIEAAVDRTAPLIAGTLGKDVSAEDLRTANAKIADILSSTPIAAIAVMDGKGGIVSVFGQMPADAAGRLTPASSSQRAGQKLLNLDLVPVSDLRAAYSQDIVLADGARMPVVFVLRTGAFQAALDAGASAGNGWRAALLNVDGQILLSHAAQGGDFTRSDVALAARVIGWKPLYANEALANEHVSGRENGASVETRMVAGGRLHLIYLSDEPSLLAAIASRQWKFMALLGVSVLALVLALSLIQNEWRRDDRDSEDTFLVLAQARASCDLLDAGVIDWSVKDGCVTYSDGWAEMFARSIKPDAQDAHEWISRIHPDDQDAARETYQSMLDGTARDVVHLIRIRLPSGLWVQVQERGRVIEGTDGAPARIVLVQTPKAADGGALKETLLGLGESRDYARAS